MTRAPELVTLDDGRLVVASAFASALRAAGLDTFEKIMAMPPETVVRAVPGRSTARVRLTAPTAETVVAYLKRYEPQYLTAWRWVQRAVGWPGAADEAEN